MILHFYAADHLEVSSASGTYLFSGVEQRIYDRVRKLLSVGAEGKAWSLLKQHKWEKK